MQGGDNEDMVFAQAVLEGRVATQGAWRDRRSLQQQQQQQQQPAVRPGVAGGSCGGNKRHNRAQQQQQQQQEQLDVRRGGDAAAAAAAPVPDADADASSRAAYSRPGPRSTKRLAHCDACGVWLPARAGDWEVHTAGIRHRRQLLSLRVHGQRNRLVLSAFETLPDSAEGAHRLVGKAAADFGLGPAGQQQAQQAQQAAPPSELVAAARRLHTAALTQLLNMFGVGQMYNAAAAAFEEGHLAACLQRAIQGSSSSSSSSGGGATSWAVSTGAELAAVAHLALTGHIDVAELTIAMDPQPVDAARSQHAGLTAALLLLLATLQRSASLVGLRLQLPAGGGPDAARLAQLWQRAWQHTLPALRNLLESSALLRWLHLVLPGCLQEATEAYLPQLAAAAATAPHAVRMQVLLALHPRVGRCCLLQLLPLAVLREVLDLAAPLVPCGVHLTWIG